MRTLEIECASDRTDNEQEDPPTLAAVEVLDQHLTTNDYNHFLKLNSCWEVKVTMNELWAWFL